MKKLQVEQAIVVEGRYDKHTLSQVVDAYILETNGFALFKDKEKMELLRQVAEKKGLIVFTDSDGAGFVIRNRLISSFPKEQLKHAYIPDIFGKERRKVQESKEGKLGVEGMSPEILREALLRCNPTFVESGQECLFPVTSADFMVWGLTGVEESKKKREVLLKRMNLPQRMSKKGLLAVINACYGKEEIEKILRTIESEE